MGTLRIVPGGLSLILTAVTTPAGADVTLYDAPAMVVSDEEADPDPIVGDEVTLPLAVTADTTLYGHDGPVVLTITRANGRALYSDQVVLSSGIGAEVTTVAPALSLAQVVEDVVSPGFPAYATADRPLATSVPAGGAIFDTTLGIPLWSTGAVWVDALGDPPEESGSGSGA